MKKETSLIKRATKCLNETCLMRMERFQKFLDKDC
jgi:hypothetical protein